MIKGVWAKMTKKDENKPNYIKVSVVNPSTCEPTPVLSGETAKEIFDDAFIKPSEEIIKRNNLYSELVKRLRST
jgi:hypothetical protein